MINNKKIYLELLKEENWTEEILPYAIFTSIIKMHNIEIVREIVQENKAYEMGFLLGAIMAIEKERRVFLSENGNYYTSVDWYKSNLRKKQLIAEGKLPREVYKDEKGKITGDNGGENWLIYSDQDSVVKFYWHRYKNVNQDGSTFHPLKRTRRYHLAMTPKNRRLLCAYKSNNDISYTKDAI